MTRIVSMFAGLVVISVMLWLGALITIIMLAALGGFMLFQRLKNYQLRQSEEKPAEEQLPSPTRVRDVEFRMVEGRK
jgi:Flp pilus assembly protein TadB